MEIFIVIVLVAVFSTTFVYLRHRGGLRRRRHMEDGTSAGMGAWALGDTSNSGAAIHPQPEASGHHHHHFDSGSSHHGGFDGGGHHGGGGDCGGGGGHH